MTTVKQKLAIKKKVALMATNGGKEPSTAEVMRQAGYSPKTARTPKKLTQSKAWPILLEEYLPDDALLERHQNALHATKIHGSLTEPDRTVDDIPTQLNAVKLGYQIKGRLAEPQVLQQFNVGGEMSLTFIADEETKNEQK